MLLGTIFDTIQGYFHPLIVTECWPFGLWTKAVLHSGFPYITPYGIFLHPAYFVMKPTVRKVYFDMVWSKFEKPNDTNYPGRCYVEKTTKFYPKKPNHFFSNFFLSKLNPFENPKNVTDRLQLTQILILQGFLGSLFSEPKFRKYHMANYCVVSICSESETPSQ